MRAENRGLILFMEIRDCRRVGRNRLATLLGRVEEGTKSARLPVRSVARPEELFRPPIQGGAASTHAFPGFRYASPRAIFLRSLREVNQ
jgi:hypothetical protein